MTLSFIRHWLQDPAAVGAIAPSSRHLANAMADGAANFDAIVEIGAGTGAITQSLVTRHPDVQLVVFELSSSLANNLRRRFPDARVISGPFHENVSALDGLPERTVLVSALPFRSLPRRVVRSTVCEIATFLRAEPDRQLMQFSYRLQAPFAAPDDFEWRRVTTIWRNAPPANVWRLSVKDRTEAFVKPPMSRATSARTSSR
jgi:phosphatidylethanolamine/phosphatidyl-N-methylethanolamine N-methyltransferase